MRHPGFPLLVASSLLLATLAGAATRPRYGGTLRVAMRATSVSPDPMQNADPGSRNLSPLIFDTLVTLDDEGRPQPSLATSWLAEPGGQRWQFVVRRGVTFSDASALTAEAAASSLRAANPAWKIFAGGESVTIECDTACPDLPAELALPRNSIVKRDGGQLSGTGPFVISQWGQAKNKILQARDDYWAGRPYLDAVEIQTGTGFREQLIALDMGKADLIEVSPEQAQRASTDNRQIENSAPCELFALVFRRDPRSAEEMKLREALSLSIDRALLNTVVLQNAGKPAGGLLPGWMAGYSFLFSTEVDLTRAQQQRAEVPQSSVWNLAFDSSDPIQRVLAERIVLNARDAGLRLQMAGGANEDVRLLRVPLASLDAQLALRGLANALGFSPPRFGGSSVDELYAAESALLKTRRVIPLLHARMVNATSRKVRGWTQSPDGGWHLPDVWLDGEKR